MAAAGKILVQNGHITRVGPDRRLDIEDLADPEVERISVIDSLGTPCRQS